MTEGMHASLMAIANVVEGRAAAATALINGTAVRALIRQGLVCETQGAPWLRRAKRSYGPYGLTAAGQAEVRERRRYETIPDNERPRSFEARVQRHLRDAKRCAYCDADPVRRVFAVRLVVAALATGLSLLLLPPLAVGAPGTLPPEVHLHEPQAIPDRVGEFTCVPTPGDRRTDCVLEVTGQVLSVTPFADGKVTRLRIDVEAVTVGTSSDPLELDVNIPNRARLGPFSPGQRLRLKALGTGADLYVVDGQRLDPTPR